ncbi:hypothetical protein J6590_100955, partial [Homalodisca vitripennis]
MHDVKRLATGRLANTQTIYLQKTYLHRRLVLIWAGPLAYCQCQSGLMNKFAVHDVSRVGDFIGYPITKTKTTMSSG